MTEGGPAAEMEAGARVEAAWEGVGREPAEVVVVEMDSVAREEEARAGAAWEMATEGVARAVEETAASGASGECTQSDLPGLSHSMPQT